jgi:aspartyl-tRNA(Asn)/glutamyl-tRNA(Gln) amidotransferase subunit A
VHYTSATEALRLFRSRELSPVELVSAVIERAEAVEPSVNAFTDTFYDEALDAARAAEKRYLAGDARPLEGLPVAVKDEAAMAGKRHSFGSLPLRDMVAEATAPFVQRIIDAGGIVHARTATPEFSCAPVTWSKMWGVTRNPWNLAYSPGGSSGGSAAALAAGTATLATGSDIGGSIRIPSSFSGTTGFKPPYGRVPEEPPFNLDHYCHVGPMARSVADVALLENVMAGPHPSDIVSLRPKLEIPSPLESVAGLRIALSPDLGCFSVDQEVAANTLAAAERLRDAGAVVEEVSLPWRLDDIIRAAQIHFGMIFGPSISPLLATNADDLTSYARAFAAESDQIAKADMLEGLMLEAALYRPLGDLLEEYDALICPTMAVPALAAEWQHGDIPAGRSDTTWMDTMMTIVFNIASRCPVLSVPSGRASNGVPTGLSVVGKTYDDVTAFRVAAAHEERYPWYTDPAHRPAIG